MTPSTSASFDHIPTYVTRDSTLRVKIIDACGMACTFCHNEGTPVTVDNRHRGADRFTARGASGRVSIYLASNGASFVSTAIPPDEGFHSAVTKLCAVMGFDEVHFTGGEPTLHSRLPELVRMTAGVGLRVCMTSNGENAARVMPAAARAGLHRTNFSVFGTTPQELADTQGDKYADTQRARGKLHALSDSIGACVREGVKASANIVVPGPDHAPRVLRLLDQYSPRVSVRLLNSLDDGAESIDAIDEILCRLKAHPIARYLTAGASGSRTAYQLPSGRIIYVKHIRPTRLPNTCAGCRFNTPTGCQEGYYGLRLYRDHEGTYQVGVCIQRMDLCQPLDEFITSPVCGEVRAFRDNEYTKLTRQYGTTSKRQEYTHARGA